MELLTRNIFSQNIICRGNIQVTLEEDINVSDTKPDIDKIIKLQGEIQISSVTPAEEKVHIRGLLQFSLLYTTSDDFRPIHNMKGQIPIEETINMEGLQPEQDVLCHFDLEDCQAKLINSRKVSIRALVSLQCCQEHQQIVPAGIDIVSEAAARTEMETSPAPDGLHRQFDQFSFTRLVDYKKDVFRIKDELPLPKGKANIDTLLYYEIVPQNLQNRMIDNGIRFLGDLKVFLIYIPEDEERRLEYLEAELPFDGVLSCEECDEEMVPDIELLGTTKSMEVRGDEDGENRILDLELSLNFRIKFYQDEVFDYLKDAYSTACSLQLDQADVDCRKLLMKNQSVLRISDHLKIGENDMPISQICDAAGTVKIDERNVVEDGIQLEGVVELDVLYLTENDATPLALLKGTIPFSHVIEVKGISSKDDYELQSLISQISVVMLDEQEIEAKVVLNLCAFVFTHQNERIITGITEAPLDMDRLQAMPGLVGFIVEKDGSLWDIAKEYNTTVESIMRLNGLEKDWVGHGDRLLLLKQIDGI